ncbi:hypothetical protein SISSUDRAFT_1129917 [Sistotremastrum suecicum HHB10207 ss-3]|uniref:Uncharacterized protein n=1 Tax=Sistotremastrum suecicum HHB10207 ss-3 TaxID=1314776 RepID=A0A166C4R7_9AGAM|nr:hypothetical protein SISSUDRAFT_1129917 [Sistotremastrum suecicum HHB10207 ss-3]
METSYSYGSKSRRYREPSGYTTEHGHTSTRSHADGHRDPSRRHPEHVRSRSLGREDLIRENYARAMEDGGTSRRRDGEDRGRGREPRSKGSENRHRNEHHSSRAPVHGFDDSYTPTTSPTNSSSLPRSRSSHKRTMSEKTIHPPPVLNVYFTSRGEAIYGFRPYDTHYRPSEPSHYDDYSGYTKSRERTRSDAGRQRHRHRSPDVLHGKRDRRVEPHVTVFGPSNKLQKPKPAKILRFDEKTVARDEAAKERSRSRARSHPRSGSRTDESALRSNRNARSSNEERWAWVPRGIRTLF